MICYSCQGIFDNYNKVVKADTPLNDVMQALLLRIE